MQKRHKGILMVISGAILWGGSGVAFQYLLQSHGFSAEFLVMARMTLAGTILLALSFISYGNIFAVWREPHDALRMFMFAVLGLFGKSKIAHEYREI